jgi:hypothetical protein
MRVRGRPVFLASCTSRSLDVDWPVQGEPFCVVIVANKKISPVDLLEFSRFAETTLAKGARLILACGAAGKQIEDVFDEVIAAQAVADKPIISSQDTILTAALELGTPSDLCHEVLEVYQIPQQYDAEARSPVLFLFLGQGEKERMLSDLRRELQKFMADGEHPI